MNIESLIETVKVINLRGLCEALGIDGNAVLKNLSDPTFGDADDTLINAPDLIECIGSNEYDLDIRPLIEALKCVPDDVLIGLGS